jgi:glutamyl-tRNA synthetase
VAWDDLVLGPQSESASVSGDFVLVRGDGVFAYQLAVAVDDWSMGITDVIRGSDLLTSTPRQIAILHALGTPDVPRYGHLPLVRAPDGSRLAKRTPNAIVRELREQGIAAADVIQMLAGALGLEGRTPAEMAANAKPGWLRRVRELRVSS